MEWVRFHSPDISLPVVKRRLGIELMELAEMLGVFLTRGGWGLLNRHCYPNRKPYWNACQRLKGKGLAVLLREAGKPPKLTLTDAGRQKLADCLTADAYWNRKWNGIWYLFVYDVPESDRAYRDVLRQFLKTMRLGCLQQSVWVTPHDIRPDYDDLSKAAQVDAFAFLFEARTVLGLAPEEVVRNAWGFGRLEEVQGRYVEVYSENLRRLRGGLAEVPALVALLREELAAYRSAFELDPLLPRSLWPPGYRGEEVFRIHRDLAEQAANQLNNYSSSLTAVELEE